MNSGDQTVNPEGSKNIARGRKRSPSRLSDSEKSCNTPVLTLLLLNVHDLYSVMNRGVELKAKAPPSIWLCYVSTNEIIADGISWYTTHIKFCHHVNMHFN